MRSKKARKGNEQEYFINHRIRAGTRADDFGSLFEAAVRLNHALTTVIKQIKEGKYDSSEDSLFIDGVNGFDLFALPKQEEESEEK